MARRLMYGWVINFAPSVVHGAVYRFKRPEGRGQRRAGPRDERRDRPAGRGGLFLHPGELALAVTYESVTLPADLVGWLDGRSSLARLGLMVHVTAHRIDPGWSGCIVLEFYNSGKLPLALRPGMPIGALSFEPLSGPAARPYNRREDAKYRDQQGAVASRIDKD